MRYIAVAILLIGSICLGQTAPPKNAQYTIFCQRITGPGHIEFANQVKQQMASRGSLRDWYVVHNAEDSVLYHGYYKTYDESADKTEAARAQADRIAIEGLKDTVGQRLFAQSMFVPLHSPDPAAPPEWNLSNAKGAYTVQIGVYKDHPDRKQIAVEAVREARKAGIEAYYYHGEAISSVCVGAWNAEAVQIIDPTQMEPDRSKQTQDVIVTSGLPSAISNQFRRAAENADANVEYLEPTLKILDPTLLDAYISKYPDHHINGTVETVAAGGKQVAKHSILVEIPHRDIQATEAGQADQAPNLDQLVPQVPKKTAEKKPKLKKLDDD